MSAPLSSAQRSLPAPGIIATMFSSRVQPQCGQLLAQLREAKGWTQEQIMSKLDIDRSTISTWENGHRWPKGTTLQRLISMAVGESLVSDAHIAAAEITTLIDELDAAKVETLDIADSICAYAYPKVLASLVLKAQGAGADSRCIALFFDHRDKVREEIRQRGSENQKNVTPQAASWLADPYAKDARATTTSGKSLVDNVEEWDVYSQGDEGKE